MRMQRTHVHIGNQKRNRFRIHRNKWRTNERTSKQADECVSRSRCVRRANGSGLYVQHKSFAVCVLEFAMA